MTHVSVVIPSYNHAPYIRQAVESVLGQSHADLELIVVDDGSSDRSRDYLRGVRDSRFQLVEQANAGAHNAINRGLAMAQGDYLAILNSDDVFHPDRLALCVRQLQTGADLVASWLEVIDHKGKVLGVKEGWRNMLPWPTTPPDERLATVDPFAINLLQSNFVSTTSNLVFSRRMYESIGGMVNLRFAHDWDFVLRAVREFRCELIAQPLLKYRTHATNTISSNRAWMLFEICWIYAVHLGEVLGGLIRDERAENISPPDIAVMINSINLQGNDRVYWMIIEFCRLLKRAGVQCPEVTLLENQDLRAVFVDAIV